MLPPGFKYLVTEMVGEATGGPQRYTGRTMEDSHRDLRITGAEWEAFIEVERDRVRAAAELGDDFPRTAAEGQQLDGPAAVA